MSPNRTAIFTICTNSYMPFAHVLVASARRAHPEIDLFVCLADEILPRDGFYPAGCTVIAAKDAGIPDFTGLAFRYDVTEFSTAIKPGLFLHLFERGYDRVLYLDPDIELFGRLDAILGPLASGASFVLTPHMCEPAEDDAPRTVFDVMRTGAYNLGFLGCSWQPETERILRWWARRLRYDCIDNQGAGIFVDQKFMDLLPGFTDHSFIARDSTLNVAYWNLGQRRLEKTGDVWKIDGRSLVFFHYSGFDANNLNRLSKHTAHFTGDLPPALRSLLEHYAAQLARHGYGGASLPPYVYARFASGTPIPDLVRHMFRERHFTWSGNPFENYEEYLQLPCADAEHGSATFFVTNLMKYLYDGSAELRSRFNLQQPDHVEAFVRWYVENGARMGLDRRLVEPVASRAGFALAEV